jgi:hypothetical protein
MKKLLSYTLLGILTAGTLASVAVYAQTNTPSQQQVQEPSFTGSIPVTEYDTMTDAEELAQYQALAKVSMTDAIAAAQKAVGTTEVPLSAELGDENGFLVWEVVVAGQEVKIDAGDAKVLYQEAVGAGDENEGDESGEDEQGMQESGEQGEAGENEAGENGE